MADRVLETIDRKKQVLTAVESGLKTATETVVPFVKEDIIDPLADTFWGRVASGAAGSVLGALEPVFNQIDRPQNALQGLAAEGMMGLKKGWSQERDYGFAEALPEDFRQQYPYISGTVGGIADIFADPTIVAGGALTKAGQKVIPNSAMKGNWAAGSPNYIDGYYADPDPTREASRFEKLLGKAAIAVKKGESTDENIQRAARKGKGAASWLATSGMNALMDTLDPYSRALYGETGINRSSQRRVENLVEKGSGRETEKAVAQAIYNSYIPLQTRRVGPLAPELQEISNYANVQNSRKMSLEDFKEGAKKSSFTVTGENKKPRKAQTPEKDIEFAYEYIKQAWKLDPENTSMLFKKPIGDSGEHLKNVAHKSPINPNVRKVFVNLESKKIKPTVENLFEELSKQSARIKAKNEKLPKNSTKRERPFTVLNPSVEHAKKNGLWLQGSFVGTAVVEGGVNVITKVMPSGRAISFVSDVHDFLEKMPVVGKQLERVFPETNLAVVGPLHQDIMGTKWAANLRDKAGLSSSKKRDNISYNTSSSRDSKEVLQDYVNVKPSAKGVAAETAKVAGRGMLTGGVLAKTGQGQEEDQ